jgi:hypothetical protein
MLPSACRSNPCGYGGICVANVSTSANSSYLCQCPTGRFGINCEHGKYNLRLIEVFSGDFYMLNPERDAHLKDSTEFIIDFKLDSVGIFIIVSVVFLNVYFLIYLTFKNS